MDMLKLHKDLHTCNMCMDGEGSSCSSVDDYRLQDEQEPMLSDDCIIQVLHCLSKQDLSACALVCKRWNELSKSQSVWHQLFLMDFCTVSVHSRLSSSEMGGSPSAYGCCSVQAKAEDAQRLLGLERETTDWRTLYQRRAEVGRLWFQGDSSSRMLDGHTDHIRFAHLDGSTLITASGSMSYSDCSIRVWDMDTGTLRQLLRGHMGPVWCLSYDSASGKLASGSDDYTVRYWDAQAGNCVSLEDPDSAVRCIHMDQQSGQMVAGTDFGRLMLWDTRELDRLLQAGITHVRTELKRVHQPLVAKGPAISSRRVVVDGSHHVQMLNNAESRAVTAIQVQSGTCASTSSEQDSSICLWSISNDADGRGCGGGWQLQHQLWDPGMQCVLTMSFEKPLNMIVGGCADNGMRVWDLERGDLMMKLEGHTQKITAHQFDAHLLASASVSGHVRVWDLRSHQCVHVLKHDAGVNAFQFDNGRLASGTWDGRVLLWDLTSGRMIQEWQAHKNGVGVWALSMDDYHIVSAGPDMRVCVRSFLPEDLRFNRW
jgi:WD40 repeat protein